MRIGAPAGFQPDPAIVDRAQALAEQSGGSVTRGRCGRTTRSPGPMSVATDTWVSMGQEDDGLDRDAAFAPYAVTAELLGLAAPDAIVLHCLPAYRGKEIEARGARRSAIGDLGRGREPAARAEGDPDVPGLRGASR